MKAYAAQLKRSTQERDRLISEHIEIARRISMRMARRCPDWIAREDLVAAGMLGLTEAAERYDATRNEPFLAFAEKRIRGAVLDELRRGDIMPRRARQMARKIGATIQALERTTGRSPTDEEVAAALGVPLEEYRTDLEHLVHVTVGALDQSDDSSPVMAGDETSPEAGAARRQALARVRAALPRLDQRDILVLGLYYNEELTYHEIAEVLGVTTSRVCQLHGRAISRLRTEIESAPRNQPEARSVAGIYVATAGAVAQSNALDATANNIANATTAGFHGDRVTFREAMTAARSPDVATVGAGTTRIDGQAGALTPTENPLDLALDGDGYFAVTTPQGPRYTRAGNFQLDDARRLVTADGFAVRGEGGAAITIPPEATTVAVAADGTVSADGAELGKLELVRFAPTQVKREGGSLVSATGRPLAGDPPKVRSGMLEASNVNVVRGVVDLVKVSRTYESLMRMIQGYHDIESRAARELGTPK